MIYNMALFYNNSHWQDNRSLFITPFYNKVGNLVDPFEDLQSIISKAKTARTPEVFIKHYMDKYSTPSNPPSWMCLELLTIGELSHLYNGIKSNNDKKRIADFFDVHHTVFTSWLHTLTYVRNICAHHGRLIDRILGSQPKIPRKQKYPEWHIPVEITRERIFGVLSILQYMLRFDAPTSHWKERLKKLFSDSPQIPIQIMGFPANWEDSPLWKIK